MLGHGTGDGRRIGWVMKIKKKENPGWMEKIMLEMG